MSLGEKMRERARLWVDLTDGRAVQIERPTRLRLMIERRDWLSAALDALVDWRGFTLTDLLPDEPPEPAPFDALAARLWLEDRPEDAARVIEALRGAIDARSAELEAAEKN